MKTTPVTLIVKAPNQQIEDQSIKCELSWSILEVKQYLSEVYPGKPQLNEQKLIYSGRLLSDNETLIEILRQYGGQETHTIHLVCNSKSENVMMSPSMPNSSRDSANLITENSNVIQAQHNDGNSSNMSWTNFNEQFPIATDANQYATQLAFMQQAYIQYITQYMQLTSNTYQMLPMRTIPAASNPQNVNREQQPQVAPPPAPPRDMENPERDWLDVFYIMSRAMILFSVVYFYSSPLRFLFVMFLGFGLYLYQIGFFRHINYNNNNLNRPPEQTDQENPIPTRLMVIWTFFTTFFASLIPEIPNAF